MENSKVFSRLMEEYGSQDQEDDQDAPHDGGKKDTAKQGKSDEKDADLPLMQQEERSTGGISSLSMNHCRSHSSPNQVLSRSIPIKST